MEASSSTVASLIKDAADADSGLFSEDDSRKFVQSMVKKFLSRFLDVEALPSVEEFVKGANSLTTLLQTMSPLASAWVAHARRIESALAAHHSLLASSGDIVSPSKIDIDASKDKLTALLVEAESTASQVDVTRSACDARARRAEELFEQLQAVLEEDQDDAVLLQRRLCKLENLAHARRN
ncbi:hypothetical protein L8N14_018855, partial [Serratia marcescens]|nr:hypothetical protein [Serratia marcescens]